MSWFSDIYQVRRWWERTLVKRTHCWTMGSVSSTYSARVPIRALAGSLFAALQVQLSKSAPTSATQILNHPPQGEPGKQSRPQTHEWSRRCWSEDKLAQKEREPWQFFCCLLLPSGESRIASKPRLLIQGLWSFCRAEWDKFGRFVWWGWWLAICFLT